MHRWWAWVFLCLLNMGLAACGGSNESRVALTTRSLALTTAAAPATYSVINLSSDGTAGPQGINATGQVAFYENTPGGPRAKFYDGATVQDLPLPGGTQSYALAINDAGQVAGYFRTASGNNHAFSWSREGGMVDLGTLGGADSTAYAINASGQIAGTSSAASGRAHAFSWTQAGGMVDLGTLGGNKSGAAAINGPGQIAGFSYRATAGWHAFLWSREGGMVDLGAFSGDNSVAAGINDSGQVIGDAQVINSPLAGIGNNRAFSWTQAGGMVDLLGTLGGTDSSAVGINGAGQVAGNAFPAGGNAYAFVWTQAGGVVNLGTLGGAESHAQAINGAGQVAGYSFTAGGNQHAFAWTQAAGMVDLNNRIPTAPAGLELYAALAISDNGAIVASSNAGLVLLKPGVTSTAAPAVGPISANDPVPVGAPVAVLVSFTGVDAAATHTAVWSWDDGGAAQTGTVTETNGAGTVTGSHIYRTAGVHAVNVKVTDNMGRTAEVSRNVVVYDPSAGFVTGGGWIVSAPGAYKKDATLAGRATFSFLSRYQDGATRPTGKIVFQFQPANLNFRSENYDWLVVSGARAQYKGSGTINGAGDYQFLLSAVDGNDKGRGGKGRLRIRIWHLDAATNAEVVDYDNQIDAGAEAATGEGTVIGGGSIVIHK